MAQEYRSLVIIDGQQRRVPDDQPLEVGNVGIVASNDGVVQKLVLGTAENIGSKPVEVPGHAHFLKDVKIDGELQVVGTTSQLDTFIAKSIFENNVQFGDGAVNGTNTQDKAEFAATIQMFTAQPSWLKTTSGDLTLDATGETYGLISGGKEFVIVRAGAHDNQTNLQNNVGNSHNLLMMAEGKAVLESNSSIEMNADAASHFKASAGDVTIDSEAANLVLHAAQAIKADASAASWLKTSAGDLDLEGSVNLQARAGSGLVEVLTSFAAAPATMMNGAGAVAGDIALAADGHVGIHADASIDMDATTVDVDASSSVTVDAGAASHFKTSAGDLDLEGSVNLQARAGSGLVEVLAGATAAPLLMMNGVDAAAGDVAVASSQHVGTVAGDSIFSTALAGSMVSKAGGIILPAVATAGEMQLGSAARLLLRSGADAVAETTSHLFVQAGGDAARLGAGFIPSNSSNLVGNSLVVSSQGASYWLSDSTMEMSAAHNMTGLSDKDVSFRAGASSATKSTDVANASLGQLHLASEKLMQLDSKAAIQLDADANSHFKTSAGNLTLQSDQGALRALGEAGFALGASVNLTAGSPAMVLGGAAVSAAGVDLAGPALFLFEDTYSVLKSSDASQDLKVQANKGDINIAAGEQAFNDTANKTGAGGDIIISAKGYIDEGTTPLAQRGGNIVIQALGQYNDLAGAVQSTDASAEGFLTLDAANELRLHPGHDGTNSKHIIVMKSDGMSPNLDVPADAVARIRNVMDPEKDQDVVTKKYMEENGGGTAKLPLSASNVPVAGDLVSLDSSGAVQTAHPTSRQYAIGLVVKVEGSEALVRMLGKFQKANSFTAGQPIYMGVDGALSQTSPTAEGDMVQRVGFALSATHILVAIGEPVIL